MIIASLMTVTQLFTLYFGESVLNSVNISMCVWEKEQNKCVFVVRACVRACTKQYILQSINANSDIFILI